jgi:LSD1 subclass zinc finger protein
MFFLVCGNNKCKEVYPSNLPRGRKGLRCEVCNTKLVLQY